MGRPFKQGLQYYSHDVDMSADPKVEAIEALYGLLGYAYFNKLLEKIYRSESGCLEVGTDLQVKVLAVSLKMTAEEFGDYLRNATERGLFDKQKYDNDHILTSNGVMKRIGEVAKTRDRAREWNVTHRDKTQDADKANASLALGNKEALISGQSQERAIEIAEGRVAGVSQSKVAYFKSELKRRGVSFNPRPLPKKYTKPEDL